MYPSQQRPSKVSHSRVHRCRLSLDWVLKNFRSFKAGGSDNVYLLYRNAPIVSTDDMSIFQTISLYLYMGLIFKIWWNFTCHFFSEIKFWCLKMNILAKKLTINLEFRYLKKRIGLIFGHKPLVFWKIDWSVPLSNLV